MEAVRAPWLWVAQIREGMLVAAVVTWLEVELVHGGPRRTR